MATNATTGLAALVLAAGAGTRLRPLTDLRPKALCPVLGRPLVDHALDRVRSLDSSLPVAVNLHHRAAQLAAHLADESVHLSFEPGQARGTAGAIGHLRPWLAGRAVLAVNADAFTDVALEGLVDGWGGERHRVLVVGDEPFGPRSRVAGALVPASDAAALGADPSGLWERCWRDELAAGRLEAVHVEGSFIDCGTVADYLEANLVALARQGPTPMPDGVVNSVIGRGAHVAGTVVDSVVWDGAEVVAGEVLAHGVRAVSESGGPLTVLVR